MWLLIVLSFQHVLADRGSHDAGMVGFTHEIASEMRAVHRHRGRDVLENASDTDEVQRDINITREKLEDQLELMKRDQKRLTKGGREVIDRVEQDLADDNLAKATRDSKKLEDVIAGDEDEGTNTSEAVGETTTTGVEEIGKEVSKGLDGPTWEECENCTQMEAFAAAKAVFAKLVGWKDETISKAELSRKKNDEYGEAFTQADGTLTKIGNETVMNADFDADQRNAAAILIGQKDELEASLSNLTA
mmetsp:Transcript_43209/g.99619  ORF Transcript_43209/g.99619 Transcript_43209/m.99619 type:complete len:247 (-) Transcript_43209:59-799(-)